MALMLVSVIAAVDACEVLGGFWICYTLNSQNGCAL
jgi:hypothetical protein